MTMYIADEAHFKEVIARAAKVKKYLCIGTADIKDLYVAERPFLGVLADLIKRARKSASFTLRSQDRISERTLTIIRFCSLVLNVCFVLAYTSRLLFSTSRWQTLVQPISLERAWG